MSTQVAAISSRGQQSCSHSRLLGPRGRLHPCPVRPQTRLARQAWVVSSRRSPRPACPRTRCGCCQLLGSSSLDLRLAARRSSAAVSCSGRAHGPAPPVLAKLKLRRTQLTPPVPLPASQRRAAVSSPRHALAHTPASPSPSSPPLARNARLESANQRRVKLPPTLQCRDDNGQSQPSK